MVYCCGISNYFIFVVLSKKWSKVWGPIHVFWIFVVLPCKIRAQKRQNKVSFRSFSKLFTTFWASLLPWAAEVEEYLGCRSASEAAIQCQKPLPLAAHYESLVMCISHLFSEATQCSLDFLEPIDSATDENWSSPRKFLQFCSPLLMA